jgi:tetraacyldisaccharide 4'-kinase
VVLDALEPFGYDRVFPRGALREPLAGLRRADAVVLSRADLVSSETRQAIRERVHRYAPETVWVEMRHRPRVLLAADGHEEDLSVLQDANVAAFCGIGNPLGFRRTLESCGARIVAFREFPDHHAYTRSDVESLAAWSAGQVNAAPVVCTHKDLVKIGELALGDRSLRAVVIGVELLAGEEKFAALLENCTAQVYRTSISTPPSTSS